jgi:hypothetical protein
MKGEETGDRHRGGRPKKDVKKLIVTAVRFTKVEHFIVKQKALKAGLGVSVYLRLMALNGQVIAKLSEEERHIVRDLIGMSNNINQLAKRAHQEGLLKALLSFESYRDQLDALLQKMKR